MRMYCFLLPRNRLGPEGRCGKWLWCEARQEEHWPRGCTASCCPGTGWGLKEGVGSGCGVRQDRRNIGLRNVLLPAAQEQVGACKFGEARAGALRDWNQGVTASCYPGTGCGLVEGLGRNEQINCKFVMKVTGNPAAPGSRLWLEDKGRGKRLCMLGGVKGWLVPCVFATHFYLLCRGYVKCMAHVYGVGQP
eukprot:1158748-Pelagomonas_calceolata.AAC.20